MNANPAHCEVKGRYTNQRRQERSGQPSRCNRRTSHSADILTCRGAYAREAPLGNDVTVPSGLTGGEIGSERCKPVNWGLQSRDSRRRSMPVETSLRFIPAPWREEGVHVARRVSSQFHIFIRLIHSVPARIAVNRMLDIGSSIY